MAKSKANKSTEQNPLFKHKLIGGFLMLFACFLFLASLSFLFSWETDHSLLKDGASNFFFKLDGKPPVNIMGKLGAFWAHLFVYSAFGIGSFFLYPVIFLFGRNIYFSQKYSLPVAKTSLAIIVAVWVSFVMALIFHNINPVLGGAFGYGLYIVAHSFLGILGVILLTLLLTSLALYFYFGVDIFHRLVNLKEQPIKFTIPNLRKSAATAKFEKNKKPAFGSEDTLFEKDSIKPIIISEEKADDDLEFIVTRTAELTPKAQPIAGDDFDFTLEVQKEKEEEELVPEKKEHYTIDQPFDPRLDLRDYIFPSVDFLNEYGDNSGTEVTKEELEKSKNLIVNTLNNYKIGIAQIKATIGPTVTLFEIVPAAGIRISKIKNLEDDIALSLAALGIRIIAPIPGKGTIGIEVPNKSPEIVSMRSVLSSPKYQNNNFDLPVCLGKTISNEVFVADLAKMPHLLMAGATGQGKSVGLNAILVSLLYKKHPAELKLVLVDPKKVELTLYQTIERHFLAKLPHTEDAIITDNKQVINTLNSLCVEMDERYALLQSALVRNIKEYNQKFISRTLNPQEGHRYLPYIVVVIDEVADLIMTAGKEVEHPIGRLAQLARAIGIHLILATQRPSVNIITGTIKANFPARAAFRVSSKIDSRTILDGNGADQLIGKGDMLFSTGNDMIRLQCPFVDTPEVEKITDFIGSQRGYPSAHILPEIAEEGEGGLDHFDASERDAMFEDAARIVVQHQQGSTSLIQRKLKVGYNRAGRLMDQLEASSIVGPFEGSKARQVLIPDEYALEQFLNTLD